MKQLTLFQIPHLLQKIFIVKIDYQQQKIKKYMKIVQKITKFLTEQLVKNSIEDQFNKVMDSIIDSKRFVVQRRIEIKLEDKDQDYKNQMFQSKQPNDFDFFLFNRELQEKRNLKYKTIENSLETNMTIRDSRTKRKRMRKRETIQERHRSFLPLFFSS
ncbi:unnamed protein product [Paramecium sonneborni]|uniref:Uncharacterized protein n=1 Tax=Paramecium sonneborni TaxID=65129 RepID=A0A8S1MUK6_9CILI|nr:unnamed protein product [Paramecium sonneborni]